jgi:excinuclease ABC subunit A
MKLARELSKRQTGRTLYLLDEPTTGLHFDDVRKLLEVLHRLTDLGNTVVIIEHNLDIIRNADYLIDMGPEGGEGGGSIVAQGPPEAVARVAASHTGYFLARYYASAGTLAAADHLPPVELPDFQKKPPKPKFIKPEKKMGVPTASKVMPQSSSEKSAAKKAAKKVTARTAAKKSSPKKAS